LDASRVAAYGGSYGGYMTLATVAFYGARVRAAVDLVGISNLVSFLQTTQAYRRDLRRAEYGDERDPGVRAVQERISPLNSVEKIEAALLVIQGKNDPRVPQSEAEQIVQALRARGKDAPYLLGVNEGHGFQKKENRDLRYRRRRGVPAAEAPARARAARLNASGHGARRRAALGVPALVKRAGETIVAPTPSPCMTFGRLGARSTLCVGDGWTSPPAGRLSHH